MEKEFREEVIGNKRIYLQRNTFHRQNVGHFKMQESPEI